jgi:colanic acid biosynthesis glycosyl transferase WcaI
LNEYYPPDTSATAKMAQLAVYALESRHKVTVICGRPSYDPTERREWKLYRSETTRMGRIIRVGSTDFPRFSMKKRLLNYVTYVALMVPRALLLKCDIVLAMTDPPFQGIVGAVVAKLKGKPFLYNIRDLYPDMALRGGIIKEGRFARLWERMHRWALLRAARVIVLGEDMRARIISKGVAPSAVRVVRDGAQVLPPGAQLPEADQEVVRAIRGDFSFVLVHAGNLGFYGAWNTLIRAVRQLTLEGVGLVFVGDGAQKEEIQKIAAETNNVRFVDFFPPAKIPSVLAAADAHVVTVKRGLEGVVVPSKLYGILSAGKPVMALAPKETDVATLALQRGFGVTADPDKTDEVVGAIRDLARNPNKVKLMGVAAKAASADYDRVKEFQKLLEVISEMELSPD